MASQHTVAWRNTLKKIFRLNPWSKFRIYTFDEIAPKYGYDMLEIIKASGRTDPYLNLFGGSMAISALDDLSDTDDKTPYDEK